ncbi:gamma-glutamyl-gamma-aminobutyrate hydrolase family protein [Acidaminobacter sp. JC074]|uniref:gamma-glutamyl-gamma-aminobutyrate hydrolase family protein n=1 Tax=Acidaminobacter sp. JC074 TaxID=2530199 RepID=UPI001F100BCF|nr:gamma-glutamyl-gamma-aminobutyrate hydrolase family protein [Acidaminobacter sp. JC074]
MKKVGITLHHYKSNLGFDSNGVNKQYHERISESGGLPVLIPIHEGENISDLAIDYAENLDMLLLTGGSDITPYLYGENIEKDCGDFDVDRDTWELALIHSFMKLSKPIMGICRGFQILNVALGGTLRQDLDKSFNKHWHNLDRPHQTGHRVSISGKTLEMLFGKSYWVNSFHHQSIDEIAPVLEDSEFALTDDLLIEMLYNPKLKIIGVQYHPEMMPKEKETKLLFELFMNFEKYKLEEVS